MCVPQDLHLLTHTFPTRRSSDLCDALLHVIKTPNATIEKRVDLMPGPDFPTGGILVEGRASIVEAYRTGRGAFRLRARWETEKVKGGGFQIVVTEIPF